MSHYFLTSLWVPLFASVCVNTAALSGSLTSGTSEPGMEADQDLRAE